MKRWTELIGATILSAFAWIGGVTRMAIRTAKAAVRRPIGFRDIAVQMVTLGIQSLPISTFLSLFIGMILTWQFGWGLADFGATMALGYAASLGLVRELIPTFLAITVGAKMAAGMTAELGSMKVTEQIDAVATLGADPIKKLVWPRVCGSTLAVPLLVVWGNAVALVGGMLIAEWEYGVPAGYFYETYIDMLAPIDYVASLVKGTIYGFLVGIIGCFQGFGTRHGTEAVGLATTETVVATSVSIIVADFYLTMIFV